MTDEGVVVLGIPIPSSSPLFLSLVAVLGSLYPASTVLLATTLTHERLARSQVVGVVLALAGAAAITAG